MKKQTKIKFWEEQTITNRFMFYKVFTANPDVCKQLLEIILGIKISKIDYPLGEKDFEADADSHAIRVDVYTEDENHVYDIEMQTDYEDDLPERSRYYQALMDIDKLKAGEPYSKLKNSIAIFICTFDPFKKQRAKYVFRNLDINEHETELGDRTEKIFINANEYDKIQNDDELKFLLKYFVSNKAENSFTNRLAKCVDEARHNSEWRQTYMTRERFEYYAEKHGYDKGVAQQKAEDEKRLAKKDAEIASQAKRIAELEALLNSKNETAATL